MTLQFPNSFTTRDNDRFGRERSFKLREHKVIVWSFFTTLPMKCPLHGSPKRPKYEKNAQARHHIF